MTEQKKNIHDEIDLIPIFKGKEEDHCWACGPKDEFQKVGDARYWIQTIYKTEDDAETFDYIELCPKHLAFLMTAALTHMMRVEKGKESGPLTLPLLQELGSKEKED